ncbi:MAG: sigma-70 family RNA polymerase sigma factor [Planctomycetota bacterium]
MVQPTRASLLIRLRDSADTDAWNEFAEIYGPMIFGFARRGGMQESDAADLVQEVMKEVASSIKRFDYNPELGRFRSWLFRIAKRTMGHIHRRQIRQPKGTGDTGVVQQLHNVSTPIDTLESAWNEEYERQILHWAADKIRDRFEETTWMAFWMTAVEGVSAQHAADELGLSIGSVYVAKNRVLKRLKQKVREIDDSQ